MGIKFKMTVFNFTNQVLIDPDLNQAEFYYKEAKSMKSIEALHKLAKLYNKMSKLPVYQVMNNHIFRIGPNLSSHC